MISVLLYCSYSGSAVGFQQAVVDESERTVRSPREGELPKLVGQIWTHGGAHSAAGFQEGTAYFLVKRMACQNMDKQRNEPGRKVFMNCAFAGGDRVETQQLADGFFACYQAAMQKLGGLLVVNDTEIGYTIQDFDGLHALLSSCIKAGRTVRPSRVGALNSPISFIALEGDWAYFTSQAGVPASPRPMHMMEAAAYQRMLAESRTELPSPPVEPNPPPKPSAPPDPQEKAHPAETPPVPKAEAASPEKTPSGEGLKEALPEEMPKRPAPPGDANAMEALEKRVTEAVRRELAEERDSARASQKSLEEQISRMERTLKRQSVWIKTALALAAAGVLLTLVLHGWGGGR